MDNESVIKVTKEAELLNQAGLEVIPELNPYKVTIAHWSSGGRRVHEGVAASPNWKVTISHPRGWRSAWRAFKSGFYYEIEMFDTRNPTDTTPHPPTEPTNSQLILSF